MGEIYLLYSKYKEEPRELVSIHRTKQGADKALALAYKYSLYDSEINVYTIVLNYLED